MLSFATIAATLMASVLAVPTTSGGHAAGAHYSLPALSGPHCVGKTNPIVLTDKSRNDPFNDNPKSHRQVIVTLYYPTDNSGSYGKQKSCSQGGDYATPGFASWVSEFLSGNVSAEYVKSFKTHSNVNAPFKKGGKKDDTPLLLYSHGLGVPSKLNQALVEDVVSHGYIVALMSHPWDSDYEEFPDGRVVRQSPILKSAAPGYTPQGSQAVDVRAADSLFVLDSIKAGKLNKIPGGGGCDISKLADRVGMFGHSLGGQLSLVVMLQTQRIIAGSNMDGWFWNGANATNLSDPSQADSKRAYMNMRADPALIPPFLRHAGSGPENEIDAMRVQTGPKTQPIVAETGHYAYCDLTQLSIPAYENKDMEKEKRAFQGWVGTVDPKRMHEITAAYHVWFFDIAVKGKEGDINDGLKYPEVTFGPIRK